MTTTGTRPSSSETRQGWKFLLSRRWLGYFILLIVFATACGFLSHWQFERRAEKVTENQLVTSHFDAEPQPLEDVLPDLAAYDPNQEWTVVEMTGEYLVDEQLLVRGRPFNGQPGFEILTPFETTDGDVFIVDRGWIPTGNEQDSPDHVPAAPEGEITVTARLKPGEREIPGRTAPAGQIATIHLPDFAETFGADRTYTGAYGLLRTESVSAETGELTPKPELTEGNHLSYAFQWIIFAVIAAVGLIYGLREEFKERNEDDPRVLAANARAEERRRNRKHKTDAEIEDELLGG